MEDLNLGEIFFNTAYEKGNDCVKKMLTFLKNQETLESFYYIGSFASLEEDADAIREAQMWLSGQGIFMMAFTDENAQELNLAYVADVIRPSLRDKKPLPKEAENFCVVFKPTKFLQAWHENKNGT